MSPEERLLVQWAQLDPEAFADIYRQHFRPVFGYVYTSVQSDATLAEDLTADVFERALRAIGRLRPTDASLRAWLMRIARNRLIDHHRAVQCHRRIAKRLQLQFDLSAADQWLDADGRAPDLEDALDACSARQRQALLLFHGRDMSSAQVARAMGASEGAVRLLVSRGMQTIRQRLAA